MQKIVTLITLATLTAPAHLGAMEAGEPETNPTSMEIEQTEQRVNGFPLLPLPVLETDFSYLSIRDQISLLIACMSPKVDREWFKSIFENLRKVNPQRFERAVATLRGEIRGRHMQKVPTPLVLEIVKMLPLRKRITAIKQLLLDALPYQGKLLKSHALQDTDIKSLKAQLKVDEKKSYAFKAT